MRNHNNIFDKSKAFEFVSLMSERQISADEFFSTVLLDAIDTCFGFEDSAMLFFDQNGNFCSWICRNGLLKADEENPYGKIVEHDSLRNIIYDHAVNSGLTYFNMDPQIYRASDYVDAESDEYKMLADSFNYSANGRYLLRLVFGINGYIEIVFFKNEVEGDFTDEEIEAFKDIYKCISLSYKNFKKHEHTKIISNIQDEIIKSGENAYLITDDYMHILYYNDLVIKHLTEVLGPTVQQQMDSSEPCLWLPFLLEFDPEKDFIEAVKIKEIRNKIFKIYNYDQSYSHGIIDRYHWITISKKNENHQVEDPKDINLTTAENKVAKLLCEGMTYQEIADTLVISYHTVKNHVQKIFFKCGVNNRYQLLKLFNKVDE